jgi:cellulose synthase/poly-beta-1,6-N-acetylglucosamine synthase-like glycosyltransferase
MISEILLLFNFIGFAILLFFWIVLFFPIKKIKFRKKHLPKVSVIVCARDEEKNIEKCIKGLLSQNYPKDRREIIVVSDSTDRTNEICRKYSKKKQIVLIERVGKSGKWNALNDGIRRAKNEIVATTDADVILPKNWLKELVRPFQNREIMLTYGPASPMNPNLNFLTRAQEFYYALLYTISKRFQRLRLFFLPSGQSMAFRKAIWKKFKFRNKSAEDFDFGYRIFKNGYRAHFVEKAKVLARVPITLSDFRFQQLRWYYPQNLDTILLSMISLFLLALFYFGGTLNLLYLFFSENSLLLLFYLTNLILLISLYLMVCLKTSYKNIVYGIYSYFLIFPLFFITLEALLRSIFRKHAGWKKFEY